MSLKYYISPLEFQHDIWTLAKLILSSEWKPDILIALWRGGATVGVGVHEYLSFHTHRNSAFPVVCETPRWAYLRK